MVTDLAEFKAAKVAKVKPLISRNRAVIAAGVLLTTMGDCERNDLLTTLQFDLTPDDVTAIECFSFHLRQRIEDRVNGKQSGKGIQDQPTP